MNSRLRPRRAHDTNCPANSANWAHNYCCATCNPEQQAPWDIDCNCGLTEHNAFVETYNELRHHFAETGSFVGFEPPYGWLDLVLDTHEKLAHNPNYRIVQIKEKFGGLRYYVNGVTSEHDKNTIREAEKASSGICQDCGTTKNVALRNHGWVATLCNTCDTHSETSATARGYRRHT